MHLLLKVKIEVKERPKLDSTPNTQKPDTQAFPPSFWCLWVP